MEKSILWYVAAAGLLCVHEEGQQQKKIKKTWDWRCTDPKVGISVYALGRKPTFDPLPL